MNNVSNNYYDYIYKILLLGDSSVGKTCFLLRYSDDSFTDNHISTIGLDYRLKMVSLENDKKIKLQIWDTAGQDRFRAITKNYYKGAHGIILIYDVCNQLTFNNIKNWLNQVKENASEKAKIVLVGNKIDEESLRKVSEEEGRKLSEEYGLEFFETSARNNIRVDETFNFLIREIYKSGSGKENENNEKKKRSNLILERTWEEKSGKKSKCCNR